MLLEILGYKKEVDQIIFQKVFYSFKLEIKGVLFVQEEEVDKQRMLWEYIQVFYIC